MKNDMYPRGERYASSAKRECYHSLMLVLCVECKLHVFELVKIYIMQLFLDDWFEGEIYSS